jgi:hypothetical protein
MKHAILVRHGIDLLMSGDVAKRRTPSRINVVRLVQRNRTGQPCPTKGFDTQDFIAEMRDINVTPRVARNDNGRRAASDGRTIRHPGYAVSLRIRKRIEEAFGWAKTLAGLRKARHRELPNIDWQFTFAMAAYNLVRLPKLLAVAA